MIHERYNEKAYLIADADELKLSNETEVVIYRETRWCDEIAVNLEGQEDRFEELKPLIVFAAENLCKMDCIAQKYDKDDKFYENYAVAYICLDIPDRIILTYYGTDVNTEFDVVFEHKGDELILKSFGTTKDISPDWT